MKSANASISSRLVHGMRSLRSGTRASLSVVRNFGATVARAASARWFLPAALAVMLIFHGLSNWHIITRNTEMILNDPTSYFSFMVKFLSNIQERNWHTVFFEQLPHVWKPPLYFVVSAPLLLIDHSIHAAVMSNIFFLGMTMLLIYVIGQKIFNSATGALSAFLFSMIPTVFALSRVFYIETALTTMVTLTFFLFISGRFRSVPVAVGTGLVMALGMLTKQPYPVYILPFFLYLVFADGQPSGVRWRNVLLAAGIALTIAAYWYAQDGRLSFDYYNRYVSERISLDRLFYLKSLSMRQLFPVFFIIVALSFFHAVRRRQYFIPAYVIFLTLVFSFSDNRQDRYLLPLFPFIALSAGNYLVSVTRRRATICALAVIFCFVQYAVISYYPQQLFRIVPYLEQYFPYNRDDNWGMYAISPRQNDWQGPVAVLLNSIHRCSGGRPLSLTDLSVVGFELEYQVLARRYGFHIEYPCTGLITTPHTDAELAERSRKTMVLTDVVVYSTPYQEIFQYWDQWPFLNAAFSEVSDDFRLIAQVPCPQGNTLFAYGRIARFPGGGKTGSAPDNCSGPARTTIAAVR